MDDRASIEREAEPYRRMTPEQRLDILDSLCRDAVDILSSRADQDRVRQYRDPLPESSVRALQRLRNDAHPVNRA